MATLPVKWLNTFKHAFLRGTFPVEMSFVLEVKARNLLLAPKQLVERLRLKPDSHVLEIGAGSGFYSVEAARAIPNGHLELLDLQAEMLEKARVKIENADLRNVGCTVADASGVTPFADESFDAVFMVTVLGEVKQQGEFLREARRVLRRGGTLSISEHLPDPDFISIGKLRRMLEENGFRFARRFSWRWAYTANFEKV